MGAERLYFKKDRDCWEYGYVTVHVWTVRNFISALKEKDKEVFDYSRILAQTELIDRFNSGEVSFCNEQSIIFSQATEFISKIINGKHYILRTLLYAFAKKSFNRFNTLKEFEDYYLGYSTRLLDELKKEFEKGPGKRMKFERLLGMGILQLRPKLISSLLCKLNVPRSSNNLPTWYKRFLEL